jgi:hypothetical protein
MQKSSIDLIKHRGHKKTMMLRALYYLPPIAMIWIALLFYGMSVEIHITFFCIVIIIGFFYSLAEMWLIAASLILVTVMLELFLSVSGLGTVMFFRPTEMLRIGSDEFGYIYQPNRHITMLSPFGDLEATSKVDIKEPRKIEFITDSLGFRNRNDYHGQKLFLVGDSFAMGEGSTQSCVITEILKNTYDQDVYNLAHSGNQPNDYVNHIESFVKLNPGNPKAIIMFFEGNDFEQFHHIQYWKNTSDLHTNLFKTSNVYRYTRWLYLRATTPKGKGDGPIIKTVKGNNIALSSWYASNVNRKEPFDDQIMRWSDLFNRLDGLISLIIFVPDKYRVYAPLFDDPEILPPNQSWEYLSLLAKQYKLPILNLTPALTRSAQEAIKNEEFVYWRGDTHWNCLGMNAAAKEINSTIKTSK